MELNNESSERIHGFQSPIKTSTIMKRNNLQQLVATLVLVLFAFGNAHAQKVADKELIGVWLMESMQWEGEKKTECGINYTQVKVYRANGEYACAEVVKQKNGTYVILPHEYGTYTMNNGVYTEMGREAYEGNFEWIDKTHFKGRWKKRHDVWKKSLNMPEKLVNCVVEKCKAYQTPGSDIQQLIGKYMFK